MRPLASLAPSLVLLAALVAVPARGECPDAPALDDWNVHTITVIDGKSFAPRSEIICQYKNNCYNYATDQKTNTFAQPGRKGSGSKVDLSPYAAKCRDKKITAADLQKMCDGVEAKAAKDGVIKVPIAVDPTKTDNLADGKCLIAMVVGCVPYMSTEIPDYHWYRQNDDGTWSHKPGDGVATTKDDDKAEITDPEAAKSEYDKFCGYYFYRCDGVQVQAPSAPPDLVDLPTGTLRIAALAGSGVENFVELTDSQVIDGLVSLWLDSLTATSDPLWDDDAYDRGFTLEAEAGTLSSSHWTSSDEVRIQVREGTILLLADDGIPTDIELQWFEAPIGFETFLLALVLAFTVPALSFWAAGVLVTVLIGSAFIRRR